jgi:hypothetical protein
VLESLGKERAFLPVEEREERDLGQHVSGRRHGSTIA